MDTVRACGTLCNTNPAALLRAQNTCVYVTSDLIHPQHGSGAVIASQNKPGFNLLSGEAESSEWKAWSGKLPRDAGVKPVKRESEAVGQWLQSSSDQAWATSADTRVEHGG